MRILVSGAAAACSRSDVAVVVELDDIAEILRQQVGDAERDVVVAEFGDLRHCQRVRYDSAFRFVLYRDGFSREVVGPRGFEHHRVFALGVGRELADVRAVVEQRAFGGGEGDLSDRLAQRRRTLVRRQREVQTRVIAADGGNVVGDRRI